MNLRPNKRLDLTVQYASLDSELPTRNAVRRWARSALVGGAQITVRFVDCEEGLALNRDYRGKDYATNILSFPYDLEPRVVGDLVVCAAIVKREAAEQGKSLEAHYAHLIVHGMLHLQGWDHEAPIAAEAMEARERAILATLGYGDPYE